MPVRDGSPSHASGFCIGVPLQCRAWRPLAPCRDVAVWVWASTTRSLCPPPACQHDRRGSLARRKKISEAHKVNVAAWSHANGIFVRAQPCVCGRIAACTQVGGLQAARSLSQQGWVFLECVCVRLCLHCSLCSGSI